MFAIWECWKISNKVLFDDDKYFSSVMVSRIIGVYSEWHKSNSVKKNRIILQPSFPMDCPIGFFDGAAQTGVCGAGFVLKSLA